MLFALAKRVSGNLRVGFVAAVVYAGLPLLSEAVLWPADAQPEATLFYLLAIWFWLTYLKGERARSYVLALVFSLLALFSKETSITLPAMLFLADRLLVGKPTAWHDLARRYLALVLFVLLYLVLMYRALTYGVFPNQIGYGPGEHLVSGFVQYLAFTAFPWGSYPPGTYLWLAIAILLFVWITRQRRSRELLFLGLAAMLLILPVLPQAAIKPRYIYMSSMVTATLVALSFEVGWRSLRQKWFVAASSAAITLLVLGNGLSIADASLDRAELSRVERVPFRTIAQRHPTFPEDTYLYFINAWADYWTTMFLIRYGPRVFVGDIYAPRVAGLRDHRNSIVIYFDDQGESRELVVDKDSAVQGRFSPPLEFESYIRLDGYELVGTRIKHGDPIALILYWRTLKKVDKDYTVFAHLVDANGQMVAGYDSQPRQGSAPTSSWSVNALLPDGIIIPIGADVPSGDYKLKVGLYYLPTLQRLAILDASGKPVTDQVVIEVIHIGE
jgi:hypothetical protein